MNGDGKLFSSGSWGAANHSVIRRRPHADNALSARDSVLAKLIAMHASRLTKEGPAGVNGNDKSFNNGSWGAVRHAAIRQGCTPAMHGLLGTQALPAGRVNSGMCRQDMVCLRLGVGTTLSPRITVV